MAIGFRFIGFAPFAAYEFWESGMQKWSGENWFAEINDQFPFPFNLLPDSVNWNLAMWAELVFRFCCFRIGNPPVRLRVDHCNGSGVGSSPCRCGL